ncbi:hypothetical protein NKDENANG_02828 [Candidatus Entotheonellaceae bacterium PAL068K]
MLRRLLRWLFYSLGVICVLALVAGLLLWWFFPAEQLQAYVIERLEQRLQRPIQVGAVRLQGLGFSLVDLRLADRLPQAPALLSLDSLHIRLGLRQLLAKRLVVEQLIMSRPQLSLVEHQGVWNLQTLLAELSGPAAATSAPSEPPSETPTPRAFPLLEIKLAQLVIQDLGLRIQRDSGLDVHLQGLTVRASGEIRPQTNHFSVHLESNPDAPNVSFTLPGTYSVSTQASLSLDLELTQEQWRTAKLSGSWAFITDYLHMGNRALPLSLTSTTEMSVDLPSQQLDIQHLDLHLGDRTVLQLHGQITQLIQTFMLALEFNDSRVHLDDVGPFAALIQPDTRLQGAVAIKRLSVQGPALPTERPPVHLTGELAMQDLNVEAPGLGIELQDLDGKLKSFKAVLRAYSPQEVEGTLDFSLGRARVAGLTLNQWRSSARFALQGPELHTGRLDLAFAAARLHYDHPLLESFTPRIKGTAAAHGNFQRGDLSAVSISAQVGSWLDLSLHGSMQGFGNTSLDLIQETTLQMDQWRASLPQSVWPYLQGFDLSGTLGMHHHLEGRVAAADNAALTLESRLHIDSPHLRYAKVGSLRAVQGTLQLQSVFSLPAQVETIGSQGIFEVQAASLEPAINLGPGQVKFSFQQPPRSSPKTAFKPALWLEWRSASLHHSPWQARAQGLTGSLKAQAQLRGDNLTQLLSNFDSQLIREPRVQGTLQWNQVDHPQLAMGSGSLTFKAQADRLHQAQSHTDIGLKVQNVRYVSGTRISPGTPLSLRWRSTQDLERGLIQVRHLAVTMPPLLRLKATGATPDWGDTFSFNLDLEDCRLGPLLARIPPPHRALLPVRQLQGQVGLSLMAEGRVAALTALPSQPFPRIDLRLNFQDLGFVYPHQDLETQGLHGTLNLSANQASARLQGDIGMPQLGFAALQANKPLAADLSFDYRLEPGQVLQVHRHELRLPHQGVSLAVQGQLAGLADFLARQAPVSLAALLKTVSARLTAVQRFHPPVDAEPVLAGLVVEGAVQNEVVFTMQPGQKVTLAGRLQLEEVTAAYPPWSQIKGLRGTLQYHKALLLPGSSALTRQPRAGSSPGTAPAAALPRVLREQLRAYSSRRDRLVIDTVTVGALRLSALAADVAVRDRSLNLDHFQANLLGGAIAGFAQLGHLTEQGDRIGVSLSGEFAQVNLARLLPEHSDIAPGAGDLGGNLRVQLLLRPTARTPVRPGDLSATVHFTRIGKQALDRLLLFLDPLERSPTIVNQRRLLGLATPRVVTLRLRHGLLQVNTELDTPLGRKQQPLSPIPLSALTQAGFPQISTIRAQLQPLTRLLQVITARRLRIDADAHMSLD